MGARVVEMVTWRGRGAEVPWAWCEGCTRGCAMWTGDVCLVAGEGFAGCKWVAAREAPASAGCAANMPRHRTAELRQSREQCSERTVQNRRAGEAAGTQKRSLAEAGGEGAGMVRIEW